jgi:hypothetical protein
MWTPLSRGARDSTAAAWHIDAVGGVHINNPDRYRANLTLGLWPALDEKRGSGQPRSCKSRSSGLAEFSRTRLLSLTLIMAIGFSSPVTAPRRTNL